MMSAKHAGILMEDNWDLLGLGSGKAAGVSVVLQCLSQ